MAFVKSGIAMCLAALALGLSSVGVRAADPPAAPAEEAAAKESPTALAALRLAAARRLVHSGREMKAPEALLAAARIIGKSPSSKLSPEEKAAEGSKPADLLEEANSLLEEAIKLSGGDDSVKKLATTIRNDIKEGSRGATGGPRVINGSVSGSDRQDTHFIRFRGGEEAIIICNNRSNRGDIDLAVVDDNGRVVARDGRGDDDASVRFFVRRTQGYQVIVRKFGRRGGFLQYTLTTN